MRQMMKYSSNNVHNFSHVFHNGFLTQGFTLKLFFFLCEVIDNISEDWASMWTSESSLKNNQHILFDQPLRIYFSHAYKLMFDEQPMSQQYNLRSEIYSKLSSIWQWFDNHNVRRLRLYLYLLLLDCGHLIFVLLCLSFECRNNETIFTN